jgi:two-component system response regulator HydG/two-component system response regulator AtoC
MVVMLEDEDYEVGEAASAEEALEFLNKVSYDLIITDYKMQKIDGMELLKMITDQDPLQRVIMVTGYGSIEHAVQAIHTGALNYIPKPVDPKKLKDAIKKALEIAPVRDKKISRPEKKISSQIHFDEIIGKGKQIKLVMKKIREIADIDVPVLVTGESGTGKELVARAIHQSSGRSDKPFIAVNTGAIAKDLIISELFGHEKGSFTGAVDQKKGKFEEANGGTLFLDEISTMNESVQIALLRVLENNTIDRVGGKREIPVNVRIVAATNENLENCISEGTFREDLYYRLNVYLIELPPLRERKEDIPLLTEHFIQKFNQEYNRQVKGISQEAMNLLKDYGWRGNVRELRNIILRAMISAKDEIQKSDLPINTIKGAMPSEEIRFHAGTSLPEIEKESIIKTMKKVKGNKAKAAELLGISRRSLYNKIAEYGIEDSE